MYRGEVPLYGNLVEIVRQVDDSVLTAQGKDPKDLPSRHRLERHGAIRLGSNHELGVIKRLFALFGMHPVGYYDLRIVDFPLHATAFRPVSEESLRRNPFRVFTSVLRKDLLPPRIQASVDGLLRRRNLFTPRLLEIIDRAEAGEIMTSGDAGDLIFESLKIFKWHSRSTVSIGDYLELKREHMMIADIACFPSAHINHLTPRTLDIDLVQKEMIRQGLPAKERIEGPPPRQCPILLRQTSFKALEEVVDFSDAGGMPVPGTHTARFGEVEQRGAAVTPRGRELYDKLLLAAEQRTADVADGLRDFDDALTDEFSSFPDTWAELRASGLIYLRYRVTSAGRQHAGESETGLRQGRVSMDHLLSRGFVEYEPITYEDFLPVSAAGIFQSNLGDKAARPSMCGTESSLSDLEQALGCKVLHEFDLYHQLQQDSIRQCAEALHLDDISMD
ncbi:DUF1338 domain protein [Pleurostoma richardsiae]|uniref:2-oxoadipate dioxygenase/decarboxylase n=1 Tax=Pleurostoma richardsiae TaxID=41990 RepID=A0AA38RKT3_9PEZI|nr:DUF1338 domain protein [Pleurostoma richardsiae]